MSTATTATGIRDRYVLISADTHAGAAINDYKPYLPSAWHDRFDAWAASFDDAWKDFGDDDDDDLRLGTSSFMSVVNWQSDRRLRDLERDGIVAEVIFPNTVPPFYPSGCLTAPAPRTREEYEARWVGIQAHNRWLADFCADAPGRRAGVAQIFLEDVDDTVAEIRRAKQDGLKGVLLPGDHHVKTLSTYFPRFDPIWATCEELGMPVHRHGAVVADAAGPETGVASPAIGLFEANSYNQHLFDQLVLASIFDRFPGLKLVYAETLASWVPDMLRRLDDFAWMASKEGSIPNLFAGEAVGRLKQRPSEYFSSNCYIGSFLGDGDVAVRHDVGVDRIMWGADYPHHEGTWPNTELALRRNFAGLPQEEVRQMTSITAASVYDLDLGYLQTLADEVGPRPEDIGKPLDVADFPDSPCPTFNARFLG